MATVKCGLSDICHVYDARGCVGSRVIPRRSKEFTDLVNEAIEIHEKRIANGFTPPPKAAGQYNIKLPPQACDMVWAGIGKVPKPVNEDDFVLRAHRGNIGAYLKRMYAATPDSVNIIVYTADAYLKDPDVINDEIRDVRLNILNGMTHVLVAVLASVGGCSPLPPYRLVHNLAGGNNEALLYTADEIRSMAKESIDFWNEWHTVAD